LARAPGDLGTELDPEPPPAAVVVVDADVVGGDSRATTCEALPAPHAARVTAKPVPSVAVTSLPGFIASLLVRKRSVESCRFHRSRRATSEAAARWACPNDRT